MHSSLHALPVLQDNVIWVWVRGAEAVVIDPAMASPVRDWLEQRQLNLVAVLQTHHHADHIGGTPELLKRWPKAEVMASRDDRERIPFQTMPVRDGDQITVMGVQVDVLDVAAHTRAHIAFFIPKVAGRGHGPRFVLRRHLVWGWLWPSLRRHSRTDASGLTEAGPTPRGNQGLLRPRVHRGQPEMGC